jgi:hypothetical protein
MTINRGGEFGISKIKEMIEKDPRKHMFSMDSKYYILNNRNAEK